MNGQLLIITNHIVDVYVGYIFNSSYGIRIGIKTSSEESTYFLNDFKDGADLIFMDGTMCDREA